MCLVSSYFHGLLPRFKGFHQELPKYVKSFQRAFSKESFSFSTLFPICNLMLSTSYMSLNAFLWMLLYLLQLKIIWISFSISFFSQFLQILISSWRLYHLVVFIAKLWDDNLILVIAFLLLKLCKFRYLSFLKSSFGCEKKVVLFIVICHLQTVSCLFWCQLDMVCHL